MAMSNRITIEHNYCLIEKTAEIIGVRNECANPEPVPVTSVPVLSEPVTTVPSVSMIPAPSSHGKYICNILKDTNYNIELRGKDNVNVSAHRVMLVLRSRFMYDLLKDSDENVLHFPDFSGRELQLLVALLYSGEFYCSDRVTLDNVLLLLKYIGIQGVFTVKRVKKTENINANRIGVVLSNNIHGRKLAVVSVNDLVKMGTPKNTQPKEQVMYIKCMLCGKILIDKGTLRKHMINMHKTPRAKEKKLFSCPTCGVTRTTKSSLKVHKLTHTGVRPWSCPECPKSFYEKRNLKDHINIHRNIRNFQCEICAKMFIQKSSLTLHMRSVHATERPFSCRLCSKNFAIKQNLTSHQISHQDDRPFTCEICTRTFKSKRALRIHKVRRHEDSPTFPCHICFKEFKNKCSLKEHMNSHMGIKEHSCSICGTAFNRKSYMRYHERLCMQKTLNL